jgi:hypothetical protein
VACDALETSTLQHSAPKILSIVNLQFYTAFDRGMVPLNMSIAAESALNNTLLPHFVLVDLLQTDYHALKTGCNPRGQ